MKGALRIALAYFSGTPLLSWISLGGFLMTGGGLLLASISSSPSFASSVVNFAQFGALIMVIGPLYNGGAWMRAASTPGIMHLRPHGRRQMLSGALLAITVSAVVLALPSTACSFTPAGTEITGHVPLFTVGRNLCGDFGLPAGMQIQLVWGTLALIWLVLFVLSSRPVLLAFMWVPLFAAFVLLERLNPAAVYTREQLATGLFAAGVAAWIAFSFWYINAPHVLRRGLVRAARPAAKIQDALPGSAVPRSPDRFVGDADTSRVTAVGRYLLDTESLWGPLGMGVLLAVALVAVRFLPFLPPTPLLLIMPAVGGAILANSSMRRARLLWLRAGLDRSALFATAEKSALRQTALATACPFVVFVVMGFLQHPSAAPAFALYTGTQLAVAACAVFAGMTYLRGAPQVVVQFVVLGVTGGVALFKLDPQVTASTSMQLGALLVFSGLALMLRGIARRSWIRLDWQVARPTLVSPLG
jgi:hypothetical protein